LQCQAKWKHTDAGVVALRGVLERPVGTFSEVADCCRDGVRPLAVQTARRTCCTTYKVQHFISQLFDLL